MNESTSPTPPIFVWDGGDVSVHSTVAGAEGHHETIDVRAGIYEGFDALGRRLNIEAHGQATKITLAEQSPTGAAELKQRLLQFFEATGTGNIPSDADLSQLVEQAHARLGMN